MKTFTYMLSEDKPPVVTVTDAPVDPEYEAAAKAVPAAPGEIVVAWGDQDGVLGADTLANLSTG
mgnify:CR=1 FL=1